MGGYNSGRHGWRGVIEHRRRLRVQDFRRHGLFARNVDSASGTWSWTQDGEPWGNIGYTLTPEAVTLRYAISGEGIEREDVQQRIGIERVPCRFGGQRAYFRCPRCGRRIEVAIMATHGRWWGCRRCMGLRYVSQGLAPAERMQRRAEAIYERLGVRFPEGAEFWPKPKWTRWCTFNRRMQQANNLSAYSDALHLRRLRRLGIAAGTIEGAIAEILGER